MSHSTRFVGITSIFLFLLLLQPVFLSAFPSLEVTVGDEPPFDYDISSDVSSLLLLDDNELFIAAGETITHIDLSDFTEASSQTLALSSDDDTDGVINALAHNSETNELVASQQDGDVLLFDLDDYAADIVSITLASGKSLGAIAVNETLQLAAVLSSSEQKVYLLDLSSRTLDRSITLSISGESSFSLNDIVYNESTDEFYVSSDAGVIFYFASSASAATSIVLDEAHNTDLTQLSAHPDGTFLYGIDVTDNSVFKINMATHAVVFSVDDLKLTENSDLNDIVAAEVKNTQDDVASGDYLFVSGSDAISVLDLANDEILDLGSDDEVDGEPLALSGTANFLTASSSTDGYLYAILADGKMAIITGNPWVSVASLTYNDDLDYLGEDGSFTLTFSADQAGTYEVRSGGDVSADGTLLTLDDGTDASGTLSADESVVLEMNYTDNSDNFAEGDNQLFIFVTNSDDERGRIASALTVDTPPAVVELLSAGFGNESVSITMTRLTASDIDHYNIYTDTDAATVLTKDEVSEELAQAASGTTITGRVTGLVNGTTYYIAVEAVDANGNVSASRSSELASGSAASAIPQNTGGPLSLSGVTGGCSLVHSQLKVLP